MATTKIQKEYLDDEIVTSGSSPTLATITTTGGIELGHASANTLTASSGVLYIEGVALLKDGMNQKLIKGRADAAGIGPVTDLTGAQVLAIIDHETTDSPEFAGINLGHASDTTLSRSAAGVLAVEGVVIPSISSTNTLTNKTITDGVNSVSAPTTTSIGYLGIPQNSQSAAYTTVMGDTGKHILHPTADTSARTFTIDSNANVAYPIGTAITFVNQNGAGTLTIAITSDTMRLAGAGTTGSRTLAANGVATAIKLTSTEWIISGTNLT